MLAPDPNEPRILSWLRNPGVRRSLTLTALWIVIGVVLVRFRQVLLPFGLAVLLAFILDPLVNLISKRKVAGRQINRATAIIGIYVVCGGLLTVFGTWAATQVGSELAGIGGVTRVMITDVRAMTGQLLDAAEALAVEQKLPVDRAEIQSLVEQNLVAATDEITGYAASLFTLGRDVVGGTVRAIFGMFLVLMLTTFLSLDKLKIQSFFESLVPVAYRNAYANVLAGTSLGLSGVVRGQLLICAANGLLTFIGLWLIGVKLPLILATVAATFSLIPIFGSILSTVPIAVMALTDSFAKGVFAVLWIVGIHLVEANVLNPKIMGDSAKIHPVLVVFALIVGEQTAGLMGALFAVPIASVVITLFQFVHRRALSLPAAPDDAGDAPVDKQPAS